MPYQSDRSAAVGLGLDPPPEHDANEPEADTEQASSSTILLHDQQQTSSSSAFLSPLRSRAGSQSGADANSDSGSLLGAPNSGFAGDQSISMLSNADPTEMDSIEESVRQSRTIEDFTKIITDFRINRKTLYADTLGAPGASSSSNYGGSNAGSDMGSRIDESSEYGGQQAGRCTCCCSREDCERALRARTEWRDLEADLRLSAEIGQALLRRHDAMQAKLQKQAEEYMQQRDGLMSRLTRSYKETSGLERQLAQANLNLEAADSSNRTLLHELDEVRGQLAKLKALQTKSTSTEERSHRLARELEDAKQELATERKRAQTASSKAKKLAARNAELGDALKYARKEAEIATRREQPITIGEDAIAAARERIATGLRASISSERVQEEEEMVQMMDSLVKDNEALRQDNGKLRDLLDACNEELAAVRDTGSVQDTAFSASPNPESRSPRPPSSLGFGDSYRVPSTSSQAEGGADSLLRRGSDTPGDQTMELDDLDELSPAKPKPLSEEFVVSTKDESSMTRTPRPPSIRRTHPGRSLSRSSFASSHLADSIPGSPRPGDGPGLLSPPIKSEAAGRPVVRTEAADTTGTTAATVSSSTSRGPDSASLAFSSRSSETSREQDRAGGAGDFDQYFGDAVRKEKDTRTGQLHTLLEYIQRLFGRLSTADVDTLSRRLQRQHLAGDVGHLARTTVNAILRDVEGLREHFRRLIEQEAKANARDDASLGSGAKDPLSESLVSRKEFFALLKAFRDILCELAKLRLCINEIHMNPGNAAKLLHEHLGAAAPEDRSLLPIPSAVGWLGKMLLGGPAGTGATSPTAGTSGSSAGAGGIGSGRGNGSGSQLNSAVSALQTGKAAALLGKGTSSSSTSRAQPTRQVSGGLPAHLTTRASAAVVSSTVAVEVKGLHASAAEQRNASDSGSNLSASPPPAGGGLRAGPRPQRGRGPGSLSRVQSRNLSGLFAGTLGNPGGFGSAATRQMRGGASGRDVGDGSDMLGTSYMQRPLSRIVDDDEVSLHHGRSRHVDNDGDDGFPGALLERTLRPRGLSDSSIRSTFIEHGTNPVARVITPATLSLHQGATMAPASASAQPQKPSLQHKPSLQALKGIAAKAETDNSAAGLLSLGRTSSSTRAAF